MATQLAEVRRSAAQPSTQEAHQQQREERESSAVPSQTTDEEYEYAGGDEKENIPPQPQARSSEVSPHRTPQGPMLHGDLHGDLAPASSSTPPAQTQVFGESLAVPMQQADDEDWTNPSQLRGLSEHDLSPGHVLGHAQAHGDDVDVWTGSEVTGEEYMDAEELEHSDNEVSLLRFSRIRLCSVHLLGGPFVTERRRVVQPLGRGTRARGKTPAPSEPSTSWGESRRYLFSR